MKKVSYVCLYSFSLLLAALPLQQMMGGQVTKCPATREKNYRSGSR